MSPTLLSLWKGAVPRVPQPRSMREILLDVAALHDITVEDLKSHKRGRRYAHPRQQAMAEMYATGRCSMPMIGSFLGRDHTTVLWGIRAHERRTAA
jgi:chromosomal replication initiation ATPase DnaA